MVDVQPATGTTHASFDGSCWLVFGSVAATNVIVRGANLLTAATPAQSAGSVDVTVRCTAGTFTAPSAFAYRADDDPAPLITAIEPAAASPGELVTVRGLNFRRDDGVKFDTTAASIADVFPDLLVVRVPELSAGRVSVLVTDLLGRTTTSGPVFSILEARPPRITGVAPATAPAGGELTLTGEGFRPGYTFEIGGSAAALVTSDYTHAIVRIGPAITAGTHPVEVHNNTGALASVGPNVQIVGGGMILNTVDPRCATTDGGIFGTMRGSGFVPGVNVAFDGVAATDVSLVDALTLRVRVPAGVAGPARITVAAGSTTASLTNGFTYDSAFAPRDSCTGRMRAARH
jgi:IPT/TIG domain